MSRREPAVTREPDDRPVAADHDASYDPVTDVCANIMCARCLAVRQRRADEGDD